ncbi:MAG: TatD family hydrolase [Candidatus Limnocylindria bacterium]
MIDAHAHLTDDRLASDVPGVLERAAAAGVERILTCGEDLASSEAAIALAERYPILRVAVGIHPHRAEALTPTAVGRIRHLARNEHVVGIGEIGIDLSGRSAPRAVQEEAFRAQVELAAELDLPVTIHVRDAGDAVRDLLDRLPRIRGHIHCYSEGPEEVEDWLRRGFWLSFAGTVTFPRSEGLRAAVALVPADRLLLETDAPYLAPQPRRGQCNEPAFIADTYAAVAGLRGMTALALAQAVSHNAAALFGHRW